MLYYDTSFTTSSMLYMTAVICEKAQLRKQQLKVVIPNEEEIKLCIQKGVICYESKTSYG